MREVAIRARVSTATVSRAFAKPNLVASETRERIEAAARDLDYRLNTLAQNLSRNRTGTVLVAVPDIGNPFFSRMLKGIEECAREFSYAVVISDVSGDRTGLQDLASVVANRRADGLILLNGRTSTFDTQAPTSLHRRRLANPLLIATDSDLRTPVATVGIDNVTAAKAAVQHLVELGHRQIAHIAGPKGNTRTTERLAGYRSGLRQFGLAFNPALVAHGDFSIASGRKLAREFMDKQPRPTAIFACNDEMAVGAISELKRADIRVPRDVAIAGFDDIDFAEACDPPLTTIRQHRYEMGRAIMSLLGAALNGERLIEPEIVMPAELIIRGSTT